MLQQPKRNAYLKAFKVKTHQHPLLAPKLQFGDFGLQILQNGFIQANQLEATRKSLVRHMRRLGFQWIRPFPHQSRTRKPIEVRMGKGKGAVALWGTSLRAGQILFEWSGITEVQAQGLCHRAAQKLPFALRLIKRTTLGL